MDDIEKLIKSIKEIHQKIINTDKQNKSLTSNFCIKDLYDILSLFYPHAALVIKDNYGVIAVDEAFYDADGLINPEKFFKEKSLVSNLNGKMPLEVKDAITSSLTQEKVYKKLM